MEGINRIEYLKSSRRRRPSAMLIFVGAAAVVSLAVVSGLIVMSTLPPRIRPSSRLIAMSESRTLADGIARESAVIVMYMAESGAPIT